MLRNKEDLKRYYKEQNSKEIIDLNEGQINEFVFDSLCLNYYLIDKLREHINEESYTLFIKDIFGAKPFKERIESELTHSIVAVKYDRNSNIIKNTTQFLCDKFTINDEYNIPVLLKSISDYLRNNRGIDSEILDNGILINMNQFKED
ncbi:TPA: hypothetical protein I9Z60_001576 [Clostridium perfringens]|nr:hypothetical protein [Clostridium perfringens]